MSIKILIANNNTQFKETLRRLFSDVDDFLIIGEVENEKDIFKFCIENRPDIVIMDIDDLGFDGFHITEKLTLEYPDISVIIISVKDNAEYLRKSMNAGAKDYIIKPIDSNELIKSIRRIYEREGKRKQDKNDKNIDIYKEKAKVILFLSPKGGTGKTTLLINMAVALKKILVDKKIAVIDLKLQFGDVNLFLDLERPYTILDFLDAKNINSDNIFNYFSFHKESGIYVLAAPNNAEDAVNVTSDNIFFLLEKSVEAFDYVFIDTPTIIQEYELPAIEMANEHGIILLVFTPEVPSIKNTRQLVDILNSFPDNKLSFLLNRGDKNLSIDINTIEKILKHSIDIIIPSQGELVVSSLNIGKPFVLKDSSAKISKAIYDAVIKLFDIKDYNRKKGLLDKIKELVG